MAKVAVVGGGIIGLASAMLLVREGHDVTVFERDAGAVPSSTEEAWRQWDRHGVAQFRQPHFFHAAARQILDSRLPDVKAALLDAGCVTFDLLSLMPPSIIDRSPRDGDERFVTVTGRRPALEYAFASTAEKVVSVIRGASVVGLLTGDSLSDGVPHVTGIRLADGGEFHADLVIDAMGRRSKLPDWLAAIGARPLLEDAEDSGFMYYTRYFKGPAAPLFRSGLLTHFPYFSLLTLPGDSGTWSVTVFIYSGDQALKALRDKKCWELVVAACPLHAHLLDGEPVSELIPMAGVTDRYRRLVVDGVPVATGILAVGDSSICTNPVGGRGITMGLMQAVGTAETIRDYPADPLALAVAHDVMTERRIAPWFRSSVEFDRKRTGRIAAAISGGPVAPPELDDRLDSAMRYDPEVFRAALEMLSLLSLPRDVLSRPGFAERINHLYDTHGAGVLPAPSREELLEMVI